MKTFEKDGRINFVDENNVLVGFDYQGSCCENFGHMITKEIPTQIEDGIKIDEEKYRFDPSVRVMNSLTDCDDGGSVTFRLVNQDDCEDAVYLTLYNSQNGYYGHGFEVKNGDEIVAEGSL